MKTIDEQIKAAKREVIMRERVYPSRIEVGKMTADECRHEIECMKAIVTTLTMLKDSVEETGELGID